MKQIAVIGGGIAGLTFARCLPSEQYEIHIFERNETFGEVGAAISVFPNALCVMDELGLLQKVLDSSGQIKKVFIKTQGGAILSNTAPSGEYPVVCIHRADLHSILLDKVKAQLHAGYTLQSLEQLNDNRVRLQFDHGETRIFDAVVGADGIHSVVRRHIIADGEPIFRGYSIWRGVVKSGFDMGYASETFGKGQRVGIVPIKDGVYGWWATCNESFMQDDKPEGTKNKLQRLFGTWHHPIPELLENTQAILKNSLVDRKPHQGWSKGNITLIGDAAHPTTPNLGQGGCMAMEGAYILARALHRYGITDEAFNRYETLQFPRSKLIVNQSLMLGRIGQFSHPVPVLLRNFAFSITPARLAMKMVNTYFSYRVTQMDI